MNTADILVETTTAFKHRDWHIIPDTAIPNHFTLETEAGDKICTLIFPGNDTQANTAFLKLIASAPELQDMVEMYHDAMADSEAEKTMAFDAVREILSRLQ